MTQDMFRTRWASMTNSPANSRKMFISTRSTRHATCLAFSMMGSFLPYTASTYALLQLFQGSIPCSDSSLHRSRKCLQGTVYTWRSSVRGHGALYCKASSLPLLVAAVNGSDNEEDCRRGIPAMDVVPAGHGKQEVVFVKGAWKPGRQGLHFSSPRRLE